MDDIDRAQQREQQERDMALDAATHRIVELPAHDDAGARICLDCAARIPHARLLASPQCVRCIDCQAVREQQQRHMTI